MSMLNAICSEAKLFVAFLPWKPLGRSVLCILHDTTFRRRMTKMKSRATLRSAFQPSFAGCRALIGSSVLERNDKLSMKWCYIRELRNILDVHYIQMTAEKFRLLLMTGMNKEIINNIFFLLNFSSLMIC